MAINRVEYGDSVLLDVSNDTVSSETLLKGATAHDASGEPIEGAVDLNNYYTKDEVDEKTISDKDMDESADTLNDLAN